MVKNDKKSWELFKRFLGYRSSKKVIKRIYSILCFLILKTFDIHPQLSIEESEIRHIFETRTFSFRKRIVDPFSFELFPSIGCVMEINIHKLAILFTFLYNIFQPLLLHSVAAVAVQLRCPAEKIF